MAALVLAETFWQELRAARKFLAEIFQPLVTALLVDLYLIVCSNILWKEENWFFLTLAVLHSVRQQLKKA